MMQLKRSNVSTKSIHERGTAARLAHAWYRCSVGSLDKPARVGSFVKQGLRVPIERLAANEVDATEVVTIADLFAVENEYQLSVTRAQLARHAWNVRLDEELQIGLLIRCMNAKRLFEIGTFNGSTTRCMAEAAGPDAVVYTLDLPPAQFDSEQSPENFSGSMVGSVYRGTSEEPRITQLLGDSRTFDYGPYAGTMDFVFVDAAHDYKHGIVDSRNALKLVRPGGLIVWHDFVPHWAGLVHAIREATEGMPLRRLGGTSMALLQT